MSLTGHAASSGIGGGPPKPGRLGAADWLGLAAAPAFAGMALLSVILGSGETICAAGPEGASLLTGMVPMYVLMSAFHAAPWLRVLRGPASDGATGHPDTALGVSYELDAP